MGKISLVAAKYIIHADIEIEGVVDKPDVIGAIFGQTEGLLGNELELRELQRSGRIGRIEVNVDTKMGKSSGSILVPSSLDKAETCVVAAALEVIQRIGPCNAHISVSQIEDVRISKRKYILGRAKELLRNLISSVLPDSQELTEEVTNAVRVMEIQEYGRERLPAGPAIEESDEIVVVEGRADVLNLLKHGIKNAIAMNGSSVPRTIIELAKKKEVIAFVDGDRGGVLDLKALLMTANIDYVARAPDGMEVEELTKKELHQALRSRITAEQAKMEYFGNEDWIENSHDKNTNSSNRESHNNNSRDYKNDKRDKRDGQHDHKSRQYNNRNRQRHDNKKDEKYRENKHSKPNDNDSVHKEDLSKYKNLLENLIGTKGAYLLDIDQNILAKVPVSELLDVLKNVDKKLSAVILDGVIEKNLYNQIEKMNISYLIALETKIKPEKSNIKVLTLDDLN